MSTYPKISIITTTYRHRDYIIDTIKGILIQQYKGRLEYIIANDQSPDDTDSIVQNFLSQQTIPENIEIKYTCHAKNLGMINNFLWAAKQCTGDYIALCEGDDYWIDPLKIQKQADFLEENKDYGLIHSNYHELQQKTGKFKDHAAYINKEHSEEFDYYVKSGDLRTCTVMFRATYLEKMHDLFRQEFMKNAIIGDRPGFLAIGRYSKMKYDPEITSVYRITSGNSASHFSNLYQYYDYLFEVNVLNKELYAYLNIEHTQQKDFMKFYKVVNLSRKSIFLSFFQLLFSGLGWKYFQQFKSLVLFRLRKPYRK
jgi:glycosyltransferase involved in cell wall biosynthesis